MTTATIDFQILANAGERLTKYAPGEVIFAEGDQGDTMYIVRSGEVDILIKGKLMESLSSGDIFGEMALIDGSPRVATARAKTDCELAPVNEKTFLYLVDEAPYFAITVMRTLADRLRRMDRTAG